MERRRIMLTGGGTLGPVTPLLAVVEVSRQEHIAFDFFWVGTTQGPERALVEAYNIPFYAISGGKLSRFFDWKTMLVPWQLLLGFYESRKLLRQINPHVVVSAGAYVSVPMAYAGWSLGIPVVVHEMDVRRGLANKLMQPVATLRTTIWPREGARVLGNVVRPSVIDVTQKEARARLAIPDEASVVLVTGGGTGAVALNKIVWASLPLLPSDFWILHLTGKGKKDEAVMRDHYVQIDTAKENMRDLLAAANFVVTRAGVGTLSELAVLKKTALVIPMPDTHQEANAQYLKEHDAAYVVSQSELDPQTFSKLLLHVSSQPIEAEAKAMKLHKLIPDGTRTFVEILQKI